MNKFQLFGIAFEMQNRAHVHTSLFQAASMATALGQFPPASNIECWEAVTQELTKTEEAKCFPSK